MALVSEAHLQIVNRDGRVRSDNLGFCVENADAVTALHPTLLIYNGTSFVDYRTDPSIERFGIEAKAAEALGPDGLFAWHRREHAGLLNRIQFTLAGNPEKEALPTDRRMRLYEKDRNDLSLVPLLYQYGRYLLLGSSRPGTQPSHLYGIWS